MQTSCWLLLAANFLGQPNAVPPLFKTYAPLMTYYYKSPDATLGPKMLKELLKEENIKHPFFEKNAHVLNIVAAQLGDIAAGKPEIVRQYETALTTAPGAGQKVIVTALMTCGDKETIKQLDGWFTDKRLAPLKEELEALHKHLADPKRKHVRDRPAKTPDDLDLLWSNFFITGEYEPISRILDVFDQPDAKENEVMKRVAKWSLGSNLQQHPKLVEIVEKHTKERPDGSKKVIGELIIKAP
jgi:hypothetical protein